MRIRSTSRLPCACLCALTVVFIAVQGNAQDDPLNKVHVPPPSTASPAVGPPAGADAPALTGAASARAHPGSLIKMNVDMVLVPITVTDPMDRLVTGLEQEDFQVYENNGQQKIRSFASEDAPVSIGIIFDLSGSMGSKRSVRANRSCSSSRLRTRRTSFLLLVSTTGRK